MSEKYPFSQEKPGSEPAGSAHQKCFIGYSTGTPWCEDLLAVFNEILPEFQLTPCYAEQSFMPNKSLREKVLELIEDTSYGIYDISYWCHKDKSTWNVPCNVFIELGIAIALNRPILLIRNALNETHKLPLPSYLEGISAHILTFSGAPTLRRLLKKHLAQWLKVSSEADWHAYYCMFGSRKCEYRDVHPYMYQWEQPTLNCHVADSKDADRSDFHEIVEEVLGRFEHLSFQYLDMLPFSKGYDFKLCSLCQVVRSSPFAIYRITPQTPPETYIAIGINLALEKLYNRDIPKLLLTATIQDIPSLLAGYEVCVTKNDYERKAYLSKILPQVIQQVQQSTWKVRPLPFIEVLPRPSESPQLERDEEEIEGEEDSDLFLEQEEAISKLEDTPAGHLERRTLLHKRYVIQKTVGRGAMGAVYQAKDVKRQQIVAVKEMGLSLILPDERVQAINNFKAEAKMLANLNHMNLPTFVGFFTERSRYYMVMEYIDGATLEELLERNRAPFSERRVLGWARQLCDVLEYLHSQQPPIIFRDMKPGNIMLTRDGHIKLIDFGIARFFRPGSRQDTQLLGTPGFAPPEQYGNAQTDERSDIYSLSITLFQLLTHTLSETGFGLRDVRAVNPAISPLVAHALEKAASLNPEDRYANIAEFRRALLGEGTFVFGNGEVATTIKELGELCLRYPEEAADYLADGEIEAWLRDIGELGLLLTVRRIRSLGDEPQKAIQMFIQAILGN